MKKLLTNDMKSIITKQHSSIVSKDLSQDSDSSNNKRKLSQLYNSNGNTSNTHKFAQKQQQNTQPACSININEYTPLNTYNSLKLVRKGKMFNMDDRDKLIRCKEVDSIIDNYIKKNLSGIPQYISNLSTSGCISVKKVIRTNATDHLHMVMCKASMNSKTDFLSVQTPSHCFAAKVRVTNGNCMQNAENGSIVFKGALVLDDALGINSEKEYYFKLFPMKKYKAVVDTTTTYTKRAQASMKHGFYGNQNITRTTRREKDVYLTKWFNINEFIYSEDIQRASNYVSSMNDTALYNHNRGYVCYEDCPTSTTEEPRTYNLTGGVPSDMFALDGIGSLYTLFFCKIANLNANKTYLAMISEDLGDSLGKIYKNPEYTEQMHPIMKYFIVLESLRSAGYQLAVMHEQGYTHGDIKQDNIVYNFVDKDVLDTMDSASPNNISNISNGTPSDMSVDIAATYTNIDVKNSDDPCDFLYTKSVITNMDILDIYNTDNGTVNVYNDRNRQEADSISSNPRSLVGSESISFEEPYQPSSTGSDGYSAICVANTNNISEEYANSSALNINPFFLINERESYQQLPILKFEIPTNPLDECYNNISPILPKNPDLYKIFESDHNQQQQQQQQHARMQYPIKSLKVVNANIIDFGLIERISNRQLPNLKHPIIYRPPELLFFNHRLGIVGPNPKLDVFAIGCLMFASLFNIKKHTDIIKSFKNQEDIKNLQSYIEQMHSNYIENIKRCVDDYTQKYEQYYKSDKKIDLSNIYSKKSDIYNKVSLMKHIISESSTTQCVPTCIMACFIFNGVPKRNTKAWDMLSKSFPERDLEFVRVLVDRIRERELFITPHNCDTWYREHALSFIKKEFGIELDIGDIPEIDKMLQWHQDDRPDMLTILEKYDRLVSKIYKDYYISNIFYIFQSCEYIKRIDNIRQIVNQQ